MNQRNYQKELDQVIMEMERQQKTPTLLLHACCAPCSSYCLEYLSRYFQITLFFYNPNIYPEKEYHTRVEEAKRLVRELPAVHPISFLEGDYIPKDFYACTKGMEKLPEGQERCFACYRLRLNETARRAKEKGYDFFATTLTISPLKKADKLNEIGEELAALYGVRWLPNDFKKRDGYKRSIELSREYHLYRQDYCGCAFSYLERHPDTVGLFFI